MIATIALVVGSAAVGGGLGLRSALASETFSVGTDGGPDTSAEQRMEVLDENGDLVKVVPVGEQRIMDALPGLDQASIHPLGAGSSLFVSQSLVAEVEPNGAPASATAIGTNAVGTGSIFATGDVDFWAVGVTGGDRVYVATGGGADSGSGGETLLDVLDSDGVTVLESDDDDGIQMPLSSTIAGRVIPGVGAKTVYIRVRGSGAFPTSQVRPYQLHVRVQSGSPTAETAENNDAVIQTLPASGWVSGSQNSAADLQDNWGITLSAGDTVYLSADWDPERDGTTHDGIISFGPFGDAPGSLVGLNDTSTTSPNSDAVFWTVKNAGTYQIAVSSATAFSPTAPHTYMLSVSVHPASGEGVNCTTYSVGGLSVPIGPGATNFSTPITSTITVPGPGPRRIADLNVSIQLNHELMADIDAHLISPAGNNNGLFTDIGETAAGGQRGMDLTLDDEAASSIVQPKTLIGLQLTPEKEYRLSWFDGENAVGNWTLALWDDAAANSGTLTGWSLTICEPPPPPSCSGTLATVYSSNFEANNGGFTISPAIPNDWVYGSTACNSGTKCWRTGSGGFYSQLHNDDLLSPSISLAGLTGPITATWAQRYAMRTASDDAYSVEVRKVPSANPRELFRFLDATMRDTVSSGNFNVDESAGWGLLSRDISSYAGTNVQLRYNLTSNITTPKLAGAAIDDVTVTGCCTAASCGSGICSPFGCCTPASCDDGNSCTTDTCDAVNGCAHTPHSDGDPCSDGNVCTLNDECFSGVCQAGSLPPSVSYCSTGATTTIPSGPGPASQYPIPVSVPSGGVVCKVRVTLDGIGHTNPDDIDMMLSGPAGQNAKIMSDVGGTQDIGPGLFLGIDDSAGSSFPDGGPLFAREGKEEVPFGGGTYKPTDVNDGVDTFPAPAPAPLGGSALSVFNGSNPNGTWNLWIVDDRAGDSGSLGRYCVQISNACTSDAQCPSDGEACTDDLCVNGACLHVNNTNACDDGNPCTANDHCGDGFCDGTPLVAPGEAQGLRIGVPNKQTISWTATPGSTSYDVVRGPVAALPVGPFAPDETCIPDIVGTSVTDATLPAVGTSNWYIVRAENCAGNGTYGFQSNGTQRFTYTCP